MMSLGTYSAISVRLFTPWQGAWTADVDVDLTDALISPTGRLPLLIGDTPLIGTVDPKASGRFATHARARVVAGGAGWQNDVSALPFHNDAGVLSSAVIMATAAEVLETAVVVPPTRFGVDFVRAAAPARHVLDGLDWYVDFSGITQVGTPRIPFPATPDIQILSFDPLTQTAEFSSDTIVVPGMILIDPRFDGPQMVRDVEQIFDDNGAHGTMWCGDAAENSFASAFRDLARAATGIAFAVSYQYRVVAQNPADGRLTLQIVKPATGIPSLATISPWYGVPGCKAKIAPGALCDVEFAEGDPKLPKVVRFDSTQVLELDLGGGADFPSLSTLVDENFAAIQAAGLAAVAGVTPGDGGATAFAKFNAAIAQFFPTKAQIVKVA